MNSLAKCFVLLLALLAQACGPAIYAANQAQASRALSRAREAEAPNFAPYEYYTAEAFLAKAREDAGEAAYQDAIAYARIADEAATHAVTRARAAMRETGR